MTETEIQKKRRICIYKILAKNTRENKCGFKYGELWDMIRSMDEAKDLFETKEDFSQTIEHMEKTNKVMVDTDDTVYQI